MSLFFYDLDLLSSYDSAFVPHQALITSSSRKPSREIGMLRNTREEMSVPGTVFDCQHARRSKKFDDFTEYSEKTEGIKKSECEEPLFSVN